MSNEEAGFVTQVAIWSYIEVYYVDGLKVDSRVVDAIKKIYNEGIRNKNKSYNHEYKLYYVNDSIKRMVLIKDKTCNSAKNINENTSNI